MNAGVSLSSDEVTMRSGLFTANQKHGLAQGKGSGSRFATLPQHGKSWSTHG